MSENIVVVKVGIQGPPGPAAASTLEAQASAAAAAVSAAEALSIAQAAAATGQIYASIAAGITGTTSTANKYFWVTPSIYVGGSLDLYLNSAGTAIYQQSLSSPSLLIPFAAALG